MVAIVVSVIILHRQSDPAAAGSFFFVPDEFSEKSNAITSFKHFGKRRNNQTLFWRTQAGFPATKGGPEAHLLLQ